MSIVIYCLTTVAVVAGVLAPSALAALPEFTVTTPFTGTGGVVTLKTEGGVEFNCTASSTKGSVTGGTKILNGTISFTGCSAKILGKTETCGNIAKETINSNQVEGTLGYINAAKREVGLLVKAKAGLTANLAEFQCETTSGAKTKLSKSGSAIGVFTPIDTTTKQYKLKFAALGTLGDEPFLNNPTHFEGGEVNEIKTIIGGAEASMTSIIGEGSVESEKEGEIKA